MASAAREYRYAHREFSTNGSLARDLDWAVRERELEHAGEVPRHERTQAAPKVYHKEQVLVRERQAIPVLSVLGVTAVAVAAVMLLLSYVQLTTLGRRHRGSEKRTDGLAGGKCQPDGPARADV